MENVTDALKIAFAVFVFIIGLGVAMHMFSLARQTSEFVLQTADRTKYYSYETVELDDYGNRKTVLRTADGDIIEDIGLTGEYRIVGLETIIPTVYNYSKENYSIAFFEKSGTSISKLNIYKSPTTGDPINILDLDAERTRVIEGENFTSEPWLGSREKTNEFLNAIIMDGETFESKQLTITSKGLISRFWDEKFEEHIGKSNEDLFGNKTTSKRYIIYVLCNE